MNENYTCRGVQRWKSHWRSTASYSVPGHEFALQRCSDREQGDTRRSPVSERLAPGPRRPARTTTRRPIPLALSARVRRGDTRPPAAAAAAAATTSYYCTASCDAVLAYRSSKRAFHTARVSMYLARSLERRVAVRGEHAPRGAGGWSCALRHAFVSQFSCVLPHPSICRDVSARGATAATRPAHHCVGCVVGLEEPVTQSY